MRNVLFILFFFVLTIPTYGQKDVSVPLGNIVDWGLFYEDENIILFSKTAACNDPAGGPTSNYVFISIENKTAHKVEVRWHYDLYSADKCITCMDNDGENSFDYTMNPEHSLIPDCGYKQEWDNEGMKAIPFAVYLSQTDKPSGDDVIKVVLSNLMTSKFD